jgi:hypothetical protein
MKPRPEGYESAVLPMYWLACAENVASASRTRRSSVYSWECSPVTAALTACASGTPTRHVGENVRCRMESRSLCTTPRFVVCKGNMGSRAALLLGRAAAGAMKERGRVPRCQGTSGTAPCPCSAWSRGPAQARRSGEHVCAQHGGRPGCGTTTTLQGSTISPRTQDLRGDRWAADIIVRQEEVLGFLDARERLAKGDKLLNVREPVHGPRCTSAKSLRRVQHRPSELFGLKTAGRQFQVSPKPFQNSKRGALPARQRGQGGSRHPEMDLQPDHPTISTLKIYFWSA